jgi:hypothetical protein
MPKAPLSEKPVDENSGRRAALWKSGASSPRPNDYPGYPALKRRSSTVAQEAIFQKSFVPRLPSEIYSAGLEARLHLLEFAYVSDCFRGDLEAKFLAPVNGIVGPG